MNQQIQTPEQLNPAEIFNEEDRIFKAWGSVEVRDADGEMLPMSEFKKIMPILMDRGGILIDSHSNRQIGKILNYEFKEHPLTKAEGVILTCKVFKNYKFDDMVWDGVKRGIYTGLSFGGHASKKEVKFGKGMDSTAILSGIEGFEFSLVESPANKPALITEINHFAKSEDFSIEKKEEITKQLFEELIKQNNAWAICTASVGREDKDKFERCVKHIKEKGEFDKKAFERDYNLNVKYMEKADKFINKEELDKSMETKKESEETNTQMPQENSVDTRLAKIEQMLMQLMSVLQERTQPMNSAELEKEETKEVKLPKTADEKVNDMDPAEGAKSDKVNFVEKELIEVKKSLSDLKNALEANKSSTPRVTNDNFLNKSNSIKKPKTWQEANKIMRELGGKR